MFDLYLIEEFLINTVESINLFLYNSISSIEFVFVKVFSLKSSNNIISSKWFWIESLDWLNYSIVGYQLFIKNIIDTMVSNSLVLNSTILSQDFFGVSSQFNPILMSEHLELIFNDGIFKFDLIDNYSSSLKSSLLSTFKFLTFNTILSTFLKFFSYVTITILFCSFFFITTGINSKSEWSDDVEYNVSTISTEAEKELFSLDDAIYLSVVLMIFIASYFGAISVGLLFKQYDISLFLISTPLLFLILLGVPFNLLYDFGSFFLLYLRGVSTTKVLLFELAYDYIGVIAFFTRLLVQFVRLVLMFVVYFMMHEAIMVYQLGRGFVPFGGSNYNDLTNTTITLKNISYYLTSVLPGQIAYLMYETLHTIFVVTAQIAAFATIAFWLFLLFYSFFVYEKHENHFKHLRSLKS